MNIIEELKNTIFMPFGGTITSKEYEKLKSKYKPINVINSVDDDNIEFFNRFIVNTPNTLIIDCIDDIVFENGIVFNMLHSLKSCKYQELQFASTSTSLRIKNNDDFIKAKVIEEEIANAISKATTTAEVYSINIIKTYENEGLL